MPGGDRTGPLGLGPRTGRAAGFCAGFTTPGFMNPRVTRGFGFGRGYWFRRFWRVVEPIEPSREEKIKILEEEKTAIEKELENLRNEQKPWKMPRPIKFRRVRGLPPTNYFIPQRIKKIEEKILSVVEFEAIRLKDSEGLDQIEAAKKMNISQPTFNRVLSSARKKIADALVNGNSIKIEGGTYFMETGPINLPGKGRRGGFGLGPPRECVCPKCGIKVQRQRGIPCYRQKCPKCGTMMIRT